MKRVACSTFWWPSLDSTIEDLAHRCEMCSQVCSMPGAQKLIHRPVTGKHWSRLHLDYVGLVDGKMILIVAVAYSKCIEEAVTAHTSNFTVGQFRDLFSRFGIPRFMVTDNGGPFTGAEFSRFLSRNHVKHCRTAPHHPQSKSLAERAVRTVKDALKKATRFILDVKLCLLLLNYRHTTLTSSKSPSQLGLIHTDGI